MIRQDKDNGMMSNTFQFSKIEQEDESISVQELNEP